MAAAALLAFAAAAHAGLGQPVSSIARDRAALHAVSLRTTIRDGFSVHEIKTVDGGLVREYASPGGTVFATTWTAPAMPDLKRLLGPHYPQYAAGMQGAPAAPKMFALNEDAIVLRVVKLPRGLAGTAHVPALVPRGVSVSQLQ